MLSIDSKKTFFEVSTNVCIKRLCKKRSILSLFVIIYQLFRFLKKEKPDYFICVGASLVLYSIIPVLFYKRSFLLWEHFSCQYKWNKYTSNLSRNIAAKFCDLIITLNEDDFNYYRSINAKRVIIIPNPAPKQIYYPSNKRKNIILSIGRLVNVKGYDLLLKSWATVEQKANWSLYIVGDGEEKQKLEELIDLYNIRNCTKIFPATNTVSDFYNIASIYVLSSRSECFPMVLLEAESYGLPIISFDCGAGVRSLVHDNVNGFLVPLGNTAFMSKKIMDLIHNCSMRTILGHNSLNIVKKYSINEIIDIWVTQV